MFVKIAFIEYFNFGSGLVKAEYKHCITPLKKQVTWLKSTIV